MNVHGAPKRAFQKKRFEENRQNKCYKPDHHRSKQFSDNNGETVDSPCTGDFDFESLVVPEWDNSSVQKVFVSFKNKGGKRLSLEDIAEYAYVTRCGTKKETYNYGKQQLPVEIKKKIEQKEVPQKFEQNEQKVQARQEQGLYTLREIFEKLNISSMMSTGFDGDGMMIGLIVSDKIKSCSELNNHPRTYTQQNDVKVRTYDMTNKYVRQIVGAAIVLYCNRKNVKQTNEFYKPFFEQFI
jgi:hypothetical protein